MKWNRSQSAAANARRLLPKLAEKYFEAGRKAAGKKRSPKALHRFRIATKRFRYSLELFQPIYGPTLDRRLEAVRGLQQNLGALSDYQTIRTLLSDDQALDARLRKAIRRTTREFQEGWKTFDSTGQLQRWKTYLGRAGSAGKTARR
ncbi:MAG: CHAD domain-containing protein [Acidobacteriia bacterium]|nr:CHAD domain-containing protein [Terriglobia bacterium]